VVEVTAGRDGERLARLVEGEVVGGRQHGGGP